MSLKLKIQIQKNLFAYIVVIQVKVLNGLLKSVQWFVERQTLDHLSLKLNAWNVCLSGMHHNYVPQHYLEMNHVLLTMRFYHFLI
ncbi:unnamed protein product [Trichobilharzia regenti]|nr:unnamed protein product [Trichobilharzia regenti]